MIRHQGSLPTTLLLAIAVLLTGCGINISRDLPDRKYYALEVNRGGPVNQAIEGAVLKVAGVRVSPRYKGRELVYRRGQLAWESDFYNQWFVLPAHMLTAQVREWLRASALFEYVPETGSHIEATHILESNVVSLYGDFREKPEAVIEMQFFVIREEAGRTGIVFKKDYSRNVPMSKASAEALVAGWNRGLEEILAALEEDLKNGVIITGLKAE